MSKTFKKGYFDRDNWGIKKVGKSNKQKRQKVKDYLRHIEKNGVDESDEDFDIEEEI